MTNMVFEQLKSKALSLPLLPGVYIMKDVNDRVIYVGKAKKLKNRVCQYFQDTASHSPKTRLMVSKIDHFDVIVCSSEFEALILECSLIKQHKPKYNILLKDDKGFPYLRLNMKERYPKITIASKIVNDGAEYFGPYGSRSTTKSVLETIQKTLRLPSCGKRFPQDIGKNRPCLHYHMKNCLGWCQTNMTEEAYMERMETARQLLLGRYKSVSADVKERMHAAAEQLNFELAASLRDQLAAVESLQTKQLVATGKNTDLDVVGFAQTEVKACFAVLHFSKGTLVDKDYEVFEATDDVETTVSSLVKQYYLMRSFAPKQVLLPVKMQDSSLFSKLLEEKYQIKTKFVVPQRGDNMHLIRLGETNALEEAERVSDQDLRINKTLQLLGKMLNIESLSRMESYDISNISGTDMVASMVVFENGKPKRSEYKQFQIRDMDHQDDYGAMAQVLRRRFQRFVDNEGSFAKKPDVLLIDGGVNHAKVAVAVLDSLNLSIPVFGMVKDDRHRTRALVTAGGDTIGIDTQQSVFSLIGNIQEETHRFAINYHKKLRSKRLRYSELDGIDGVGPKRKQDLLKAFKSISAISKANLAELERVVPRQAALNVYNHFNAEEKEE